MWLLPDAGYRQAGTHNLHVGRNFVKATTQEAAYMKADITHAKYADEKLCYDTQNTQHQNVQTCIVRKEVILRTLFVSRKP